MTLLQVLFAANAIWFAMAFDAFYRRRHIFAKVLVPNREDRNNSAYEAVIESGRFMGGFSTDAQWATLLIFNALAHSSQFFGNVPMALQNRNGGGLWNVFKGVMLLIFVLDFTLMVANGTLAVWLLA